MSATAMVMRPAAIFFPVKRGEIDTGEPRERFVQMFDGGIDVHLKSAWKVSRRREWRRIGREKISRDKVRVEGEGARQQVLVLVTCYKEIGGDLFQ